MPTFPILQEGSVREAAAPNLSIQAAPNAEAFGGGQSSQNVFEAAQNVSKSVESLGLEYQKQADESLVQKRTADTLKYVNDELLWHPETGAYAKKGESAMGVTEEYGKKFNDYVQKQMGGLNNPAQRAMYQQASQKLGLSLNEDLTKHTFSQAEVVQKDNANAAVSAARDNATLNWADPVKRADSLNMISGTLTSFGHSQGWSDEKTAEEIKKALSDTHKSIITQMLDQGQDLAGQSYFKNIKKELTADDLNHVSGVLEVGSRLGESQRVVDTLIQNKATPAEATATFQKLGLKDPKLRQEAEQRWSNLNTLQEKAVTDSQNKAFNNAYSIVVKDPTAELTPTQLIAIGPQNAERLMSIKKQLISGVEPPENGPDVYNLRLMAALKPNDYANVDLSAYADKLTRAEMRERQEEQAKMIAKDNSISDVLNYRNQNFKIKSDVLDAAGLSPNSGWFGSEVPDGYLQISNGIDREAKQKEKALGRPLAADEFKDIVNKYAAEVVKGGLLFGKSKFVGNVMPEDIQTEDIPKDVRDRIAAALVAKKQPVNDDNIKKTYIDALRAGKIKPVGK